MSSFHFDHVVLKPEAQIGRHSQPTWELDYIIRGRGIKEIGNATPMPFQEGEVVLIHPNIEHVWHFDHLPTILKSADKKISTPKLTSFSVRLAFFPGQVFVWVINGVPRICEDIISPFPIKADGSCLCDHRRHLH